MSEEDVQSWIDYIKAAPGPASIIRRWNEAMTKLDVNKAVEVHRHIAQPFADALNQVGSQLGPDSWRQMILFLSLCEEHPEHLQDDLQVTESL